jgi:hypothetical protein
LRNRTVAASVLSPSRPMKTKLLLSAALATTLFASGCATRVNSSGGRETTLLLGAITTETKSFQPPPATTVDVDTSKIISGGNPSGGKVTLLWGLITLRDY